jgi:hypothetical protein
MRLTDASGVELAVDWTWTGSLAVNLELAVTKKPASVTGTDCTELDCTVGRD